MSLPLLKRRTKTADFGLQRSYVANRPHSNTTEFICATARFRQLAGIDVCGTTFLPLLRSLDTSSVRFCHRRHDAGGQETQLEAGTASRILGVENRHAHTRYLREQLATDATGTPSPWEPQNYRQR
ncbi:hypothetical protein ABIA25_002927 [Sinorhizobium fredii]